MEECEKSKDDKVFVGSNINIPFRISYKGDFACLHIEDGKKIETGFTKEGLESILSKAIGF